MRQQHDSGKELSLAAELVEQYKDRLARNTCRIFVFLMLFQWIGAIVVAAIVSPLTWTGTTSSIHPHVWASLFLGGVITLLPVVFALLYPSRIFTRHVIAAGQMLMSALLIHI